MPLSLRVLQLYNRVPHPPRDGGVKAVLQMRNILESLGCTVRCFTLNPSRNRVDPSSLPISLTKDYLLDLVEINSHITLGATLASLASHVPYHLLRFQNNRVEQKLDQVIKQYRPDLILLEGLSMALYRSIFEKYPCKTLYRSHNIESDIIRQKAESFSPWNPLRIWMNEEYRKMKSFERETAQTAHAVLAISAHDLVQLKQMAPEQANHMHHWGYWPEHPTPIDARNFSHKQPAWDGLRPLKLGFIGTMDWLPNQDAVQWMLDEWIPQSHGTPQRTEFHVAGRKAPAKLAKPFPNYSFHGEVEDAATFMGSCDAMVFPLRMGSGVKIKILEAITWGIPVISTSLGVQGLELEPGVDYLRADSPQEFAEVLHEIQRSPHLLSALAQQAFQKTQNQRDDQSSIRALSVLLEYLSKPNPSEALSNHA